MASIINATTSTGLVSSADNSGSLQLATNNGTTAVTIDTSQRVGIGTASPAQKLHVASSSATYIQVQNTGNSVNAYYGVDTGGGWMGTSTNHYAAFYTNNTERMRIDADGRVTMSAQPCFYAYSFSNNTQDVVKTFDTIPINVGSYYNNTNGRFTAPVAGIYEFRAGYIGVNGTTTRLKFFKNGAIVLNGDASVGRLDGIASGNELPFGEVTVFLNLAVSDYITLVVSTDDFSSLTNLGWGKFCGQLMQ
jgi:hypothetical protein